MSNEPNTDLDELKEKVSKTLFECMGIDAIAEVLKQLADEADNEFDERMWLQGLGILTGGEMPPKNSELPDIGK